MTTVNARLVVRFSGTDTDVCLRADEESGWTTSCIAYSPSDEAKELVALDGWSEPLQGGETSLTVQAFVEEAATCLENRPTAAANLAARWKPANANMALPGHLYLNQKWVPETVAAATAGTYTACAVPLVKVGETEVYYETAMVGSLMVRIDFWISLSIS